MNGNTGLRLRTDFSKRAGGNRGAYRKGMNMQGLGAGVEAGNILEAADPVGLYVTGCQKLFGMPEDKQTGVWDYATHQAMTEWVGRIDEPSDMKEMPSWGEAPSWTARFATDLVLACLKNERLVPLVQTLLAHIGAPISSGLDLLVFLKGEGTGSPTWKRTIAIFDAVTLYVTGCEGGVAYGSPAVQTEGIIAAAGAFAGSVAGILLVG